MADKDGRKLKIPLAELRVGHFIDLERSWMDHPFLFSRFQVANLREIAVLRQMGLTDITVIVERSDRAALNPAAAPAATAEAPAESEATIAELNEQKQDLMKRASGFREERQQAAVRYAETVARITSFSRDLRIAPANAMEAAGGVVGEMVKAFDQKSEVLLNLVNLSDVSFSTDSHSLNVTVLSMLLARHLQLSPVEMQELGIGALMHDVGKIEIPTQITHKKQPLTPAEEAVLRTHPLHGSKLARTVGTLPAAAVAIIEQHHELLDGTGYPRKLPGHEIKRMVRIVAIANSYDNFCNPADPALAQSPRDAMAHCFKAQREKLDRDLVGSFIKVMGVYPPGTVVQLNDENLGMVISVDAAELLRPRVILYNPDIPREEALMVDLRERTDLEVKSVLKPTQFPPRICEYLGLSERLGYFYKSQA
jgi:HD-GYP domain-containing protein (c-di-GMP phosphodiesterase class II)